MISGFLEPLGTFICGFEYIKLLLKIKEKPGRVGKLRILEIKNSGNSEFWNLGILEL